MNVKKTVGENLAKLRKSRKLTQLEIAETFSYSDKAVSKWEKGETLPDIETLTEIASYYGVDLNYLVTEHNEDEQVPQHTTTSNKIAITLLMISFVWILVTIIYMWLGQTGEGYYYQCFIWGIPSSFLIMILANMAWGKKEYGIIFHSFFLWTLITAVYCQFGDYGEAAFQSTWVLFLLGAPIQATIIMWAFIKGNPLKVIREDFVAFLRKTFKKKKVESKE